MLSIRVLQHLTKLYQENKHEDTWFLFFFCLNTFTDFFLFELNGNELKMINFNNDCFQVYIQNSKSATLYRLWRSACVSISVKSVCIATQDPVTVAPHLINPFLRHIYMSHFSYVCKTEGQNGIFHLMFTLCVNCLSAIPQYSRFIDFSIIWMSIWCGLLKKLHKFKKSELLNSQVSFKL